MCVACNVDNNDKMLSTDGQELHGGGVRSREVGLLSSSPSPSLTVCCRYAEVTASYQHSRRKIDMATGTVKISQQFIVNASLLANLLLASHQLSRGAMNVGGVCPRKHIRYCRI